MGVKRLVKAFVVFTIVAISASAAYHYYVDGKTPSSAMFQALEEYNSAMNGLVTAGLDQVEHYRG